MNPKEKAEELFNKMENDFQYFASREIAIQHALIAVEEMQDFITKYNNPFEDFKYWDEVKNEIEKL